MKTIAIIQARMSSSRLPGKSLMDMGGVTLLERVTQKIVGFHFIDEIIIATTLLSIDDGIERECKNLGFTVFRGDPLNVLKRYIDAAAHLSNDDTVVRFTADNPMYNSDISEAAHSIHVDNGNDYTCIDGLSHVVPEFISVSALRLMKTIETTSYEQEHVTPFFRNHVDQFRTTILPANFQGLDATLSQKLTVDTKSDYSRYEALSQIHPLYEETNIQKIYTWLKEHQN